MVDKISKDPQLTAQLQKTADDLKQMEQAIRTGMIDARVLIEFREAVNHVRHTTWAVQKWAEEEKKAGGKPFEVISMIMAERMRIATLLARELGNDLANGDVDFSTPGLKELYQATVKLAEQLKPLVPK
ncbi:MAG TPA: hypothetical protein VEG08_14860 [Terriglobales bacterium]|nr:hypothetical protein [Terriglobales bacterium]